MYLTSKLFSVLLFLVLSSTAMAAGNMPSAAAVSQTGGAQDSAYSTFSVPNGADPVILEASVLSITAGGDRLFFTANGAGSQAQYQLPSGSKLYCPGYWITGGSASNWGYEFGYNTSTFTNDTATAAGDVCFASTCVAGHYPRSVTVSANVQKWVPMPVKWDASASGANANIYPWVRSGQGTGVIGFTLQCWKY